VQSTEHEDIVGWMSNFITTSVIKNMTQSRKIVGWILFLVLLLKNVEIYKPFYDCCS